MATLTDFNVVWLTGPSCDGCTISVLGDNSVVAVEKLLAGGVPGLPKLHLFHPVLALEQGEAYVEHLRRAERGQLDPFALVVEASVPNESRAGAGFFSGCGEENGRPIPVSRWLEGLAPKAAVVVALGDCAVWGGPHSKEPNPSGATGVSMFLGLEYKTTLGLPVVNLPGCCVPPVFIATVAAVLKWVQGQGPFPELDEMNRPKFFDWLTVRSLA